MNQRDFLSLLKNIMGGAKKQNKMLFGKKPTGGLEVCLLLGFFLPDSNNSENNR